MEFASILKSQANQVFLFLAEKGWNTSEFKWKTIPSPRNINESVSQIVHLPSNFYFTFDNTRGSFYTEWAPGKSAVAERANSGSYSSQFTRFKEWVDCLAREVNSPNLWADMPSDTKLIETAVTDEDNTKFTAAEKKLIVTGIGEIKEYLLTTHKMHAELVEGQLKYLVESSGRLGRKDWKNALIGALFGMILQSGVGSQAAQQIFQFVWTVLSVVLLQKFYLQGI